MIAVSSRRLPLAVLTLVAAAAALLAAPAAIAQEPPSHLEIRRGDEVLFRNEEPEGAIRVLFIGNSLTYFNELPWVFQSVVASVAPRPPVVARFAGASGRSLEASWNDDEVQRLLRTERWDYVVLQEKSQVLAIPDQHREYLGRFVDRVRERAGTPVLFATWPNRRRGLEHDALRRHYATVAREHGLLLAPVGTVWERAMEAGVDPYLDSVHPNFAGTYLAACVLAVTLLDVDPRGAAHDLDTDFAAGDPWRASLVEDPLDAVTARRIQELAWQGVKGERGRDR